MIRRSVAAVFALLAIGGTAPAADLAGTKQIALKTKDGAAIPIGQVTFHPQSDGSATYDLDIDYTRFKTFFLSMRDFKCLEGPEIQCYVPYPYAHPHVVRGDDLRWLEHDLLFFFKHPTITGRR